MTGRSPICILPDPGNMRNLRPVSRVLIPGCALFLAACSGPQSGGTGDTVRLLADDARIVAEGRTVYQQSCAQCHGDRLEGQADWRTRGPDGLLPAPPHDETGHTWHHADQMLFDLTKYGPQKYAGPGYRSTMPAYEGTLTDEEIIAVLSYIKSEWSAAIRARHDGVNAQYRQVQDELGGR